MKRLFRWALAILCLSGAYSLFRVGIAQGVTPGALAALLAMFFCVIVAAVLLLPDSLPVVARPFTALIDAIYGTGPGKGRPPLSYALAEGYVKQVRMEEALSEYWRMIKLYPREAEAYRRAIELLLREFGDREEAAQVLRRGLRKVRPREERAALRAVFDAELRAITAQPSDREEG